MIIKAEECPCGYGLFIDRYIDNKEGCPACDPELGETPDIRLANYKKIVGWVIPKEVTAEWGRNIRFLPPGSVTLCNANDEEVMCACGKPAETFIAGKEAYIARCNSCMEIVPFEDKLGN